MKILPRIMVASFFFTSILAAPTEILCQESPPEDEKTLSFNFMDASVDAVLQYVSKETGYIIIKEAEVTGTITAMSADKIPLSEALDFLNSVLKSKGVTTMRIDNIVKIVTIDEAKRRNIEIHIGSIPEEIELSDKIITQIIPLKYSNATEIQKELSSLLSKTAELAINSRSNSLILTDTSVNVHRFVKILAALDHQISDVLRLKVYTLVNADAEELAATINEVFRKEEAPQQQGEPPMMRFMRMFRGGPPEGGAQETPEEGLTPSEEIKAVADKRTNSLVVSASEDYIKLIDELVQKLDGDTTVKEGTMVIRLKNAKAENLESVLSDLFSGTSTTAPQAQQAGPRQALFMRAMQSAESEEEALSGLVGEVKVKAETDTNSIIIVTSTRNFDAVKSIVEALDQVRSQVLIKVLIAQVTLDNFLEFGVEGLWENEITVARGDSGTESATTSFGIDPEAEGFRYTLMSDEVEVKLQALRKDGKLKVLSTPRILVLDNEKASITVGREVPFVRNTRLTDQGTTMNTIEYEDIGIILNVTPQVNPDGLVTLAVAPEISVIAPESESVMITEGVTAPVFEKNTASTTVAVMDGQTVVIGGLIRDSDSQATSKVPLLGDLPILGPLFSYKTNDSEKTELMIFVTPYVVTNAYELESLSKSENKNLRLIQESDVKQDGPIWERWRRD